MSTCQPSSTGYETYPTGYLLVKMRGWLGTTVHVSNIGERDGGVERSASLLVRERHQPPHFEADSSWSQAGRLQPLGIDATTPTESASTPLASMTEVARIGEVRGGPRARAKE